MTLREGPEFLTEGLTLPCRRLAGRHRGKVCTRFTEAWSCTVRRGQILLILGGSKSGKSACAEGFAERLASLQRVPLVYAATMIAGSDPENLARIAKHRKQRAGKGYLDRECQTDVSEKLADIPQGSVVLLDCLSNLCANEMFCGEVSVPDEDKLAERLSRELTELARRTSQLVLVGNDVFSDALAYDEGTLRWRRLLGRLQTLLGRRPETLCFEVSAGIPLYLDLAERR